MEEIKKGTKRKTPQNCKAPPHNVEAEVYNNSKKCD